MKDVSPELQQHYHAMLHPAPHEHTVDACMREFAWFRDIALDEARDLIDVAFALRAMGEADSLGDVLEIAGKDSEILILAAGTLLSRDRHIMLHAAEGIIFHGRRPLTYARAAASHVLWRYASSFGAQSAFLEQAMKSEVGPVLAAGYRTN